MGLLDHMVALFLKSTSLISVIFFYLFTFTFPFNIIIDRTDTSSFISHLFPLKLIFLFLFSKAFVCFEYF